MRSCVCVSKRLTVGISIRLSSTYRSDDNDTHIENGGGDAVAWSLPNHDVMTECIRRFPLMSNVCLLQIRAYRTDSIQFKMTVRLIKN